MITIEYRLLLDGRALGRAELDRVQTVTVTRSVYEPGEADVEILICAGSDGRWLDAGTDLVAPCRRVRVELRVGSGAFQPIFEGTSRGVEMRMAAEPGASVQHLRAYDDTTLLDYSDPDPQPLSGAPHQVVQTLLDDVESFRGDLPQMPATDGNAGVRGQNVPWQGSAFATIEKLAQDQRRLFFVKPGKQAGYSIACFKEPTREVSSRYPPLVLLGRDRNVDSFETSHEYSQAGDFSGAALRLEDRSVAKRSARLDEGQFIGTRSALPDRCKPPRRVLHPLELMNEYLVDTVVDRQTEESGYLVTANARLRTREYGAVIEPDTLLVVTGAELSRCGTYYVEAVTHTLDRSEYIQALQLRRNAAQTAAAASFPLGRV